MRTNDDNNSDIYKILYDTYLYKCYIKYDGLIHETSIRARGGQITL